MSYVAAIIASLENYIKSGKVDLNLSVIVNEARLLLNNIRELDYSVGVGKTEQTLRFAAVLFIDICFSAFKYRG